MTRFPARDSVPQLRDEVASFHAHACRLAHEQVIFEDGRAKRLSRGIGLEPALGRVGLCAAEHRARQLSCAHTTARYVLVDAVVVLQEHEILTAAEAQALRLEIEEISDTIHATDWSKGEAEACYALTRERAVDGVTSEAERRIAELVESHQRCVERLQRLQRHILDKLEEVLFSLVGQQLLDHDDTA